MEGAAFHSPKVSRLLLCFTAPWQTQETVEGSGAVSEESPWPPETASVAAARRFVTFVVRREQHDVDALLLAVSELVSNAVLHARSRFTVRVTTGEVVRAEVFDGSDVLSVKQDGGPTPALGEVCPRSQDR